MVGMTRFERATPSSQAKCATSCATSRRHYIQFVVSTCLLVALRYLPPPKTIINCFLSESLLHPVAIIFFCVEVCLKTKTYIRKKIL